MDLKAATLFAAVATILNLLAGAFNYLTIFTRSGAHLSPQLLAVMFTQFLFEIALLVFFFTLYSRQ